jgi:hypothetical protein
MRYSEDVMRHKLYGWEMDIDFSVGKPIDRNKYETLASAEERLCLCCRERNRGYNIEGDYVFQECKHDFDPRCADGSDCPYFKVDPEACAAAVMNRICEASGV